MKPGYYQSGPTTKVICPAGKAGQGGSSECVKCLSGQYQNVPGKTTCIKCPTGWSSDDGSAKCQQCGAGTYGYGCRSCPIGFARSSSNTDSTKCQRCKRGETTSRIRS